MRRDLTGNRFERLVVVKYAGTNKSGSPLWECRCDCGKVSYVTTGHLTDGTTRSCGCLYTESRHTINKTHGESKTRLYRIWADIKTRCYNSKSTNYYKYGGRGICMCDEWFESYQTFEKWALSNGYKDNLTIDRIDSFGNYKPSNCRWVTQKVQQNNRSNNHLLTYNNETLTISQWSEKLGFKKSVIGQRINGMGWSVEKALTTPIRKTKNNLFGGKRNG